MPHQPVTTLAELDALDEAEIIDGYRSAERGDPEPGANHSRSYHHGWRTRMMDLGELPIPDAHRALTRADMVRQRANGHALMRGQDRRYKWLRS